MDMRRNETIGQMSSIGAFFRSMFTEWSSAVTGGMSVPLTVGAFYVSGQTQKICFAGLAGILGFYAAFKVFSKEHDRALSAETQIDNQLPKLSVQVDGATWEFSESSNATKIWLSVTVGNGGGSSVVKNWAAKYIVGDLELPMTIEYLGNYGERITCGKRFLELNNADLLQARTVEVAIDRRCQRRGKILFAVPGNRTPELSELRSAVKLSCCDFEGKLTDSIYRPTTPEGTMVFYAHEDVKEFTNPTVRFL